MHKIFSIEMFRRRRVLRAVCKRHRDPQAEQQRVNPYRLFAIVQRRMVWCPVLQIFSQTKIFRRVEKYLIILQVYKAASTNWMKNIPRLVSRPEVKA